MYALYLVSVEVFLINKSTSRSRTMLLAPPTGDGTATSRGQPEYKSGLEIGIEPTASRSTVKRSIYCAYPAATER